MTEPRTLFDKIWANHLVDTQEDGTCLIYIDRHLVHEVTSPQAFAGLRAAAGAACAGRTHNCVADHNIPGPGCRGAPGPHDRERELFAQFQVARRLGRAIVLSRLRAALT